MDPLETKPENQQNRIAAVNQPEIIPVPVPDKSKGAKVWKWLIVLLIIAVCVLIVFGFGFFYPKIFGVSNKNRPQPQQPSYSTSTNATQKSKSDTNIKTEQMPFNQLPKLFPADFPIESSSTVIANTDLERSNYKESSRTFISQNTVSQNYEFYKTYFVGKGWEVSDFTTNIPAGGKSFQASDKTYFVEVIAVPNYNTDTTKVTVMFFGLLLP